MCPPPGSPAMFREKPEEPCMRRHPIPQPGRVWRVVPFEPVLCSSQDMLPLTGNFNGVLVMENEGRKQQQKGYFLSYYLGYID